MTEKRFTLSERDLNEINNSNAIADDGIPCTQRHIVKLLNELYDENQKLLTLSNIQKKALVGAIKDLTKENEQLKQFKEKVFTWIDKEIARNEEAIEWGKETGADSGAMGFYNHMLKRLKKELKE